MPKKKSSRNVSGKQGRKGPRGGEKTRAINEKLRQLKKFPKRG